MHVVLYGNLSDGFKVVGPFDDFGSAAHWAEGQRLDSWVVAVVSPEAADASQPEGT